MHFEEFIKKYQLQLNDQQKEAVKTVEGPVLLLAVPGSGKTTVLVSRLGYMLYCKGIDPRNILVLTYTVAATKDMAARFAAMFGVDAEAGNQLEFRTINGICASIINYYGRRIGKEPFKLITDEKNTAGLLSAAFQKVEGEYPTESDMKVVRTWISYIKNSMLSAEEIHALNEKLEYDIADIYQLYTQEMKKNRFMDFDDQMLYAFTILRRVPDILELYQQKYRYICVDEAQDTSKIQHVIIGLLAGRYNNLFMVGDEDQSIYGFRAAYPQALLAFERQHPGAKVLLMEENFRSNAKIVRAADAFIQKNTKRHEKHMRATRPSGADIKQIPVGGRISQYRYLLKLAENCQTQTAILYRDNESILPLVDLLERKKIPYQMRNAELTFFTHRIVQDIQNCMRFALDPSDTEVFMQIYYKVSSYLNKQKAIEICKLSGKKKLSILETAIRFGNLPAMTIVSCKKLQLQLECLLKDDAQGAIQRIVHSMGYAQYLERAGMSDQKIFILQTLARKIGNARDFISRLEELQKIIREKKSEDGCPLILSTIHASKGLEYDQVYLIDVVDGLFPESVVRNAAEAKEEELETYEEERRLFYVGVTRAKENLLLFDTGKPSVFQKDLFPNRKTAQQNTYGTSPERGRTAGVDQAPEPGRTAGMGEYQRMRKLSINKSLFSRNKQAAPDLSKDAYQKYVDSFGEGMLIRHKKFGHGVITGMKDDWIQVAFEHDIKTLQLGICFKNQLLKEVKK